MQQAVCVFGSSHAGSHTSWTGERNGGYGACRVPSLFVQSDLIEGSAEGHHCFDAAVN